MPVTIDGIATQRFSECDTNAPFPSVGESPRKAPPKIDQIYPEVYFPSNKIFLTLGEEKIRALVKAHHALIRDSKLAPLYPQEDEAFEKAAKTIEDFFVQMLGGKELYTSIQGHPKLRERHFLFEITETERDIWLMCFRKALKQMAFPKELLPEIWNWVEALSMRLVNRRTTMDDMKRYSYDSIQTYFDEN